PAGLVELVINAKQADVHGMKIGIVSTANICVGVGKFSDHFTEDVGQRITIGDAWQKLSIFVMNFLPINSVHFGFIEEVAFLAPDLVEDVLRFLRRINLCAHSVQAERAIADFFGFAGGARVDDAVGISGTRTAALALTKQLGSVEGKRETLDTLDQSFLLAFFQVVGVNRGFFTGQRAIEPLGCDGGIVKVSFA